MNHYAHQHLARLLRVVMLLAIGCPACGCRKQGLETVYGQQSSKGALSVNGTSVLATMISKAGHEVSSARKLTDRIEDSADVIFWFPDDFHAPREASVRWLEAWLRNSPGRVLIYVGRDYDAAVDYWTAMSRQELTDEERRIVAQELGDAQERITAERVWASYPSRCDWFELTNDRARRVVKKLSGDWAAGIDVRKTELKLGAALIPADPTESLLIGDEDEPIISRRPYPTYYDSGELESQLLLVNNGSFLLNMPLVNKEHRKLAQRVIDQLPAKSRVVMLESGLGDVQVGNNSPPPQAGGTMDVLSVWPLNWILLHLAIVGLIFCFARYPIFGLPRDPQPPISADFGKHVDALGELLQNTGDRDYARSKLQHYLQLVATDSMSRRGRKRRGR